jgi:hypothetical protein
MSDEPAPPPAEHDEVAHHFRMRAGDQVALLLFCDRPRDPTVAGR